MEAPDILPGDDLYLDALKDLSSTRLFESGPIPFDKIVWYSSEILGLNRDLIYPFVQVIQAMDRRLLKNLSEERKRKERKSAPSQPSTGPSKPRHSVRMPGGVRRHG